MLEPERRLQRQWTALIAMPLLLWMAQGVSALDPGRQLTQYSVDIWDSEDGLPVNSILSITQTEDGYLWLASQSGLARFNGVTFHVFGDRDLPDLGDVNVVYTDREGELWIGTEGSGPAQIVDGRFQGIPGDEALSSSRVMAIHQSRDGTVWIGTLESGLFGVREGIVTRITSADGLSHDSVRAIHEDQRGTLWIATDGGGLCGLDNGQIRILTTQDGLPSDIVLALAETPDGAMWAGTYGGGAARIDGDTITTLSEADGLPHGVVRSLLTDPDGNLWFGTYGGLCRYRDASLSCIDRSGGLGSSFVRSLYLDVEGSLWVGTFGGGLSRLKDGTLTPYSTGEGLSAESVWAVFQDSAQRLWVGTNGGGLTCLLPKDQRRVITTAEGLSHDTVLALAETNDGSLWVGTREGLNRIENQRITVFDTRHGLLSGFVRALFVDRQDRLWIGTAEGLSRRDDEGFVSVGIEDGLPDKEIRCVHQDSQDTIWVGTSRGGLFSIDGDSMKVREIVDGLSEDFVTDIHEDGNGILWIATDKGLAQLREGRVSHLTTDHGLPDDELYRILEDDSRNLWISSSRGVFSVGLDELSSVAQGKSDRLLPRLLGKTDGMRAVECNGGVQPSGWKTSDGRLWFPTGDGVVAADPGQLFINTRPPRVLIESVLVNDETVPLANHIEIPPGRSRLEIHYAALSLLEPRRVRYRYFLEGFDEGWIDAGNRGVAYYTNIPPGSYAFRVTGSNNDGVWAQEPAELSLQLEPSFHQTPWFHMLWISGVVALALGGLRLRDRRLRQTEQELLRLVDERTRQLGDANRQLERLVHVDGLTEIANRRHLEGTLEVEWRRHARTNDPLAIIMVDLDYFKAFNDTYGHQDGDDCLRRVATTLCSALRRPADLVARYGGEEFVALLPDTNIEGAREVAERMRELVEGLGIQHESSAVASHVTVSLGVSSARPTAGSSPAQAVQAADTALYAAKAAGRNTIRTSDDRQTRASGSVRETTR